MRVRRLAQQLLHRKQARPRLVVEQLAHARQGLARGLHRLGQAEAVIVLVLEGVGALSILQAPCPRPLALLLRPAFARVAHGLLPQRGVV